MVAVIRNGTDRFALDIACPGSDGINCDPLKFHGKAGTAWEPVVEWELYNGLGHLLAYAESSPQVVERDGDSTLAALWAGSAYPFAESRERYLGSRYGFVDASVSLLALESDRLESSLAAAYREAGVPRLTQADISPPDTDDVFVPITFGDNGGNPWVTAVRRLVRPSRAAVAMLPGSGAEKLRLDFASLAPGKSGTLRVTLFSL